MSALVPAWRGRLRRARRDRPRRRARGRDRRSCGGRSSCSCSFAGTAPAADGAPGGRRCGSRVRPSSSTCSRAWTSRRRPCRRRCWSCCWSAGGSSSPPPAPLAPLHGPRLRGGGRSPSPCVLGFLLLTVRSRSAGADRDLRAAARAGQRWGWSASPVQWSSRTPDADERRRRLPRRARRGLRADRSRGRAASARRGAPADPEDEERLRDLLDRHGEPDSLGYFALRRDKSVIFSPSGKAAVSLPGGRRGERWPPATRSATRRRGPGDRAPGWPRPAARLDAGGDGRQRGGGRGLRPARAGRAGARRRGDRRDRRRSPWRAAPMRAVRQAFNRVAAGRLHGRDPPARGDPAPRRWRAGRRGRRLAGRRRPSAASRWRWAGSATRRTARACWSGRRDADGDLRALLHFVPWGAARAVAGPDAPGPGRRERPDRVHGHRTARSSAGELGVDAGLAELRDVPRRSSSAARASGAGPVLRLWRAVLLLLLAVVADRVAVPGQRQVPAGVGAPVPLLRPGRRPARASASRPSAPRRSWSRPIGCAACLGASELPDEPCGGGGGAALRRRSRRSSPGPQTPGSGARAAR